MINHFPADPKFYGFKFWILLLFIAFYWQTAIKCKLLEKSNKKSSGHLMC
jgi:hypothetical protein